MEEEGRWKIEEMGWEVKRRGWREWRELGFWGAPNPKTCVSKPNLPPNMIGDLGLMFGVEFGSKLVLQRAKNQRKPKLDISVRDRDWSAKSESFGSDSVIFAGLFWSIFRILGRFCNFLQMLRIAISAHFLHFLQGKIHNNIIHFIPKINHLI